ncbi:hypothetical protein J1605_015143 [Eschrichtius robustus]|uniref:Uncharacterized protein n=1 Tax=Eschrichtius robustus TaxID=9764 RepID=A0AB34GAD6_ESCRO|nr:hypothetical protein J1605_015143 [Eschrichtius robustus]
MGDGGRGQGAGVGDRSVGGAGSGGLEAGGRSSASVLRTQRPTPAPVTVLAPRSPLCGRRGRAPAPRPPR